MRPRDREELPNEEVFVPRSALEELFSASQQLMVTNIVYLFSNFSHDLGYHWGLPACDFCRFIPRVWGENNFQISGEEKYRY